MLEWSGKFLDWVLLCTIVIMIASFLIDIWRSAKDKKDLSKENGDLSKEHDDLSKEHNRIIEQNEHQAAILSEINKELYGEIKKRDVQFENLSLSQKDAYKQLEAFTFLMNEVKRLQTENIELKKELKKLNEQRDIQYQKQQKNKRL